ncbi:MAG: EF2563 family selenium-dependent molybdenum hydroxylase system protein [Rhodospirillales bacterium]|jgi:xanthine dehydrogenase accessory factor|nr:EF2563 family selenium-dependent molybdenum hydroxylase system protein [Rhodospirillales bacterium]
MISPFILIKGAGEMASAVAHRLYGANLRRICLIDIASPLAVRRSVSFCPALELGRATVEGLEAVAVGNGQALENAWSAGGLGVALLDDWRANAFPAPDVVVDAILAKRNLGTDRSQAGLVIALGPGFEAGIDAHLVIETNRGHDLGRIIRQGPAAPNTGIPGNIGGFTSQRVLRAPGDGLFVGRLEIGDAVKQGEVIGQVGGMDVAAPLDGVLRGLIRSQTQVTKGLKIGDIDPRGDAAYCFTISDKARAIAGSVLEAVLSHVNQ